MLPPMPAHIDQVALLAARAFGRPPAVTEDSVQLRPRNGPGLTLEHRDGSWSATVHSTRPKAVTVACDATPAQVVRRARAWAERSGRAPSPRLPDSLRLMAPPPGDASTRLLEAVRRRCPPLAAALVGRTLVIPVPGEGVDLFARPETSGHLLGVSAAQVPAHGVADPDLALDQLAAFAWSHSGAGGEPWTLDDILVRQLADPPEPSSGRRNRYLGWVDKRSNTIATRADARPRQGRRFDWSRATEWTALVTALPRGVGAYLDVREELRLVLGLPGFTDRWVATVDHDEVTVRQGWEPAHWNIAWQGASPGGVREILVARTPDQVPAAVAAAPPAERDVFKAGAFPLIRPRPIVDAQPVANPPLRPRPAHRFIRNPRDAEEVAAEWLTAMGFEGVRCTPMGADGGVDVHGEGLVAQVKLEGVPTGRPAVQRLVGAAFPEQATAVFFAQGGYTAQAIEYGNAAQVALFAFDLTGTPAPVNAAARALFAKVSA